MIKSILVMSKTEVELERIKLERLGLLEDSCWRLGEMIRALKQAKRGEQNYERV